MRVRKFEIQITLDNGIKSTIEIDSKELCAVLGEAAYEAQNLGEVLSYFALIGVIECHFSVVEAAQRIKNMKI